MFFRQKEHTIRLIREIISSILTDGDATSNLLSSQDLHVLGCLIRPLPVNFTKQLMKQLPNDWVFCTITMIKNPSVILVVRVSGAAGRKTNCLIVKLPIITDKKVNSGMHVQMYNMNCN